MDATFLFNGLTTPHTLIPAILEQWKPYFQYEAFKQYEPEGHKVLDPIHRRDKTVTRQIPGAVADVNGNIPTQTETIPVTRTALALQKLIVTRAVAFLTGGGCTLKTKDIDGAAKAIYEGVNKAWEKNKLDYKNAPLAERVMSQLEIAEIWYSEIDKAGKVQMRCKFYSPADGYQLCPVFDNSGDLIAFGMKYRVIDIDGKERHYFDLYTNTEIHRYVDDGGWVYRNEVKVNPIPIKYGKIPVVYWSLPKSAWQDVQTLIEQLEKVVSNYGDTNLHNGNPLFFYKGGAIQSMPEKEAMGKIISTDDPNADARYISIDAKPEMVIYEVDTLVRNIYALTQTPDLSFEAMKGLGDISGEALKRLLIDAHLKAIRGHTGWYGEGMQRRINFLIAAYETILNTTAPELSIVPQFSLFDIDGGISKIKTAIEANGGNGIMSIQESIGFAGLSENPQQTYQDILTESGKTVTA